MRFTLLVVQWSRSVAHNHPPPALLHHPRRHPRLKFGRATGYDYDEVSSLVAASPQMAAAVRCCRLATQQPQAKVGLADAAAPAGTDGDEEGCEGPPDAAAGAQGGRACGSRRPASASPRPVQVDGAQPGGGQWIAVGAAEEWMGSCGLASTRPPILNAVLSPRPSQQ
jgi:hypothetical protein